MKKILKIENKKTAIFLACLAISTFMWLLIKLSKEYQMEVKVALVFQNMPKDKILINQPDSIISVKVTDNGFDMIGISLFGASEPMSIQVDKLRQKNIAHHQYKSFVMSNSFYDQLRQEFSSATFVTDMRPDSIIFIFEEQTSKKVKIDAQLTYQLSPQYQLSGDLILKPDSITIYGSETILEGITSISTKETEFEHLESSVHENIPLVLP
ncbi:MAG: hypothetical protein GQ527_02730, partial [Bacteroidales bacterium]|nr:hypothetical protein [Bacteroidales bacterium]